VNPNDNLSVVSRTSLALVREDAARGKLSVPLVELELRERGIESEVAKLLVAVLGELSRAPLLAVLDTIIGERERAERERPRLLWTGPKPAATEVLDTRVTLLELLAGARTSVFWAGYRFDDAELLAPLHEGMCARKLDATFVLEVPSDNKDGRSKQQRIDATVQDFFGDVWTWTDVRPRLYIDPRTAGWNPDPEHPRGGYYALMHAKAVVVDAEFCIVGSANFTDAGTTRNIEAGVLLRNPTFARTLLRQWQGLIANGMLREVGAGHDE
jgi:phosphatidylserine/phosphatidylglycerophosphate/cardiolipin synthase-like enzyme